MLRYVFYMVCSFIKSMAENVIISVNSDVIISVGTASTTMSAGATFVKSLVV